MTNTVSPILSNLKHLPYGGAGPIETPDLPDIIKKFVVESSDDLGNSAIHTEFVDQYKRWIKNSKLNDLQGLDAFPVASFSNGTTEAFDKFYLRHHQRRFRCLRGEYMYHPGSWKNYFDWAYLDQDELKPNDALVISLPFSDLGNIHPDTNALLDQCRALEIPVLVDCAFFGLCSGINFDLDHPAVTDVTFSLSKTLPVAHLRIGMRLTRSDDDDSLLIYNKTNYVNRLAASVGLKALQYMDADTNWQNWHSVQQKLCLDLKVHASNTVIFGIDDQNLFKEYNRGTSTNRLCFYKVMYEKSLEM
jgi:hypothetical protein